MVDFAMSVSVQHSRGMTLGVMVIAGEALCMYRIREAMGTLHLLNTFAGHVKVLKETKS
jgi:hypothetical protein